MLDAVKGKRYVVVCEYVPNAQNGTPYIYTLAFIGKAGVNLRDQAEDVVLTAYGSSLPNPKKMEIFELKPEAILKVLWDNTTRFLWKKYEQKAGGSKKKQMVFGPPT